MATLKPKFTERLMLDRLNTRYSRTYANGAHQMLRYAGAEHVRITAGFESRRTADYIAMDLWPNYGKGLDLIGHEVKVSRGDWLSELRDPDKAETFKVHMDRWFLVASDPSIVKPGELPEGWGLMVASGSGLRVAVPAPKLDPLPVPKSFLSCLLRATARTAKNMALAEVSR